MTGALSTGGCDPRTKHNREELPHIRGQGQKPGGPHAWRAVAKRSYPTSEVKGSSQECHAVMAQEWPRRATQVWGQGWRLGGATPHPRSGAGAGRTYPTTLHLRPGQRPGGATPRPRSCGCMGTGRPRGAIPCWRSGRAAVRRYP